MTAEQGQRMLEVNVKSLLAMSIHTFYRVCIWLPILVPVIWRPV